MSDTSTGVSFMADLELKQDPDFLWQVDVTANVDNGVVFNLKITTLRSLFVHHGTLQAYWVDGLHQDNTGAVDWLNKRLQTRLD